MDAIFTGMGMSSLMAVFGRGKCPSSLLLLHMGTTSHLRVCSFIEPYVVNQLPIDIDLVIHVSKENANFDVLRVSTGTARGLTIGDARTRNKRTVETEGSSLQVVPTPTMDSSSASNSNGCAATSRARPWGTNAYAAPRPARSCCNSKPRTVMAPPISS